MQPAASAPNPGRLSSLAKTYGPWVVAVLALGWVTRSVRWHELSQVVDRVPVGRFLLASAVLLWLNCMADVMAMYFTFGWFGCRLKYKELIIVRGATYLLAVIQYYAGMAAILGYLHKQRGVPILKASGWILFISGINMGVLLLIGAAGMAGGQEAGILRMVPAAAAALVVVYAAILVARPPSLARFAVLAPLFEMGLVGHIKATIVRLPHVFVLIVWHYLSLRWFGVELTIVKALTLLPAVFFATALPISVQGLGPAQAAAIYFFAGGNEAGKAAVLAYSLAMTSVSLIVQVGVGLAFLPAARRLGLEEATDATGADPQGAVAATAGATAREAN